MAQAIGAIYGDRRTRVWNEGFFRETTDLFPRLLPDCPDLTGILQVFEPEGLTLWIDAVSNHALCGIPQEA